MPALEWDKRDEDSEADNDADLPVYFLIEDQHHIELSFDQYRQQWVVGSSITKQIEEIGDASKELEIEFEPDGNAIIFDCNEPTETRDAQSYFFYRACTERPADPNGDVIICKFDKDRMLEQTIPLDNFLNAHRLGAVTMLSGNNGAHLEFDVAEFAQPRDGCYNYWDFSKIIASCRPVRNKKPIGRQARELMESGIARSAKTNINGYLRQKGWYGSAEDTPASADFDVLDFHGVSSVAVLNSISTFACASPQCGGLRGDSKDAASSLLDTFLGCATCQQGLDVRFAARHRISSRA